MNVLITNTLSSHVTVPTPKGVFNLLPGVNEVDADLWELALNIKLFAKRVDDGDFVATSADSITDVSPKAALKLIEATYNLELLLEWQGKEARKPVRAAIEKQIKAIEDAIAKRTEKKAEGGK